MPDVVGIASPDTPATAALRLYGRRRLSGACRRTWRDHLGLAGNRRTVRGARRAPELRAPLAGSLVALARGGKSLIGSAYSIACVVKCAQTTLLDCHRRTTSGGFSFSRFEQRRRTGAELFQQRRLIGLCGGEMPLLDMTEAANFFRDRGETDGEVMIVRPSARRAHSRASPRNPRSASARCGARASGRTDRMPCRAGT